MASAVSRDAAFGSSETDRLAMNDYPNYNSYQHHMTATDELRAEHAVEAERNRLVERPTWTTEGSDHDDDDGAIESEEEESSVEENAILTLTRRLRCLFSVIAWPIVPLGTIVTLALMYSLYAAFVLNNSGAGIWFYDEPQEPCSHPLHAYVAVSLALTLYAPNHAQLRAYFCNYLRERDGPNRPPAARHMDQTFHTISLLYVYCGITLMQTCREDLVTRQGDVASKVVSLSNEASDTYLNTCQATCPVLTKALTIYVTALELFTVSLILPLLFLPCIYLWFLRQAASDQEALAELQQRLGNEEDDDFFGPLRSPRSTVTAEEILQEMQSVKLVSTLDDRVMIISTDRPDGSAVEAKPHSSRECCICMGDFYIHADEHDSDVEAGADVEEDIVRTPACHHLFHKQCIASWVGGRWEQTISRSSARARRSDNHPGSTSSGNDTIENDDIEGTPREVRRQRRRIARRTTCPLCRADLRPSNSGSRSPNED